MSENNSIGLAELIEQVKRELSDPYNETTDVPFLAVGSVELELQVTVKKEGKTGIKINVLTVGSGELGGGISRDSIQKVKVTLSPLFSKEKLLEDYLKRHPDQIQKLSDRSIGAMLKNVDDESSVGQQF